MNEIISISKSFESVNTSSMESKSNSKQISDSGSSLKISQNKNSNNEKEKLSLSSKDNFEISSSKISIKSSESHSNKENSIIDSYKDFEEKSISSLSDSVSKKSSSRSINSKEKIKIKSPKMYNPNDELNYFMSEKIQSNNDEIESNKEKIDLLSTSLDPSKNSNLTVLRMNKRLSAVQEQSEENTNGQNVSYKSQITVSIASASSNKSKISLKEKKNFSKINLARSLSIITPNSLNKLEKKILKKDLEEKVEETAKKTSENKEELESNNKNEQNNTKRENGYKTKKNTSISNENSSSKTNSYDIALKRDTKNTINSRVNKHFPSMTSEGDDHSVFNATDQELVNERLEALRKLSNKISNKKNIKKTKEKSATSNETIISLEEDRYSQLSSPKKLKNHLNKLNIRSGSFTSPQNSEYSESPKKKSETVNNSQIYEKKLTIKSKENLPLPKPEIIVNDIKTNKKIENSSKVLIQVNRSTKRSIFRTFGNTNVNLGVLPVPGINIINEKQNRMSILELMSPETKPANILAENKKLISRLKVPSPRTINRKYSIMSIKSFRQNDESFEMKKSPRPQERIVTLL